MTLIFMGVRIALTKSKQTEITMGEMFGSIH